MRRRSQRGFTLIELLVSIVVVTILASSVLYALMGVQETARIERSRSQVNRLHELIVERWESYEARRVKFDKRGINPRDTAGLARRRLDAIREVMRMEMPDRYTDLISSPTLTRRPSSLATTYARRCNTVFQNTYGSDLSASLLSTQAAVVKNQGSEMLYLIISQMQDGNASALEFFSESEIGDTDGDGMLEILDGWGTPISFLRWAPGAIVSPLQAGDPIQTGTDPPATPDPLDYRGLHNLAAASSQKSSSSFALFPLIYSAGPDKKREILVRPTIDGTLYYCAQTQSSLGSPFPNDPYYIPAGGAELRIGSPYDSDGNGNLNHIDNITNHFPGT